MRTVIFLGLLFVAIAICASQNVDISTIANDKTIGIFAAITLFAIIMDILEWATKVFKPKTQ